MGKPQKDRVLEYIKDFGSITVLESIMDLGVYRLSSRIFELKKAGYPIKTDMISVKNRFGDICNVARYSLDGDCECQTES